MKHYHSECFIQQIKLVNVMITSMAKNRYRHMFYGHYLKEKDNKEGSSFEIM